jgi:hypothetical protein
LQLPSLGSGGSELLLSGNHSLNTVVHVLHESFLTLAETVSVGDIVGAVSGLGVLSVDTTDLNVVLVGDLVESLHVLAQEWELDVDRASHGGSEVGWARGDVTEMFVVGERADLLDSGGSTAESVEDGVDVSTWLHGDDSELVLLVDPHEESLVVVVEDSTTVWPVTVQVAGVEETISLPKMVKIKFWRSLN